MYLWNWVCRSLLLHVIYNRKESFDTITLYVNSKLQEQYNEKIITLNPKRIIFNPGTENEKLANMAKQNNIQTTNACTLVLLRSNQY